MNGPTPNAESKYLASPRGQEQELSSIRVYKDAAQLVHRAKAMVVKPNGEPATAAEIASDLIREGFKLFMEKYVNNGKSYNPDNK